MKNNLDNVTSLSKIILLWEEYEEYLKEEVRKEKNIKDETKKDWGIRGFRGEYKYLLNFESFIDWLKNK